MTHSASAQTRKRVLIVSLTVCALILIGGIAFTVCMYLDGGFARGELVRRLWYAVLCIAMIAAIFLVELLFRIRFPLALEVSLMAFAVAALCELLFRIRFPLALEVSLMAFAVAALCGGNLYGLYGYVPFWDKLLHTLSGPLFSIVGLSFGTLILKDMPEGVGKAVAVALFAFLFSLAVGYLWEVFEYSVDSLMPGGYNNQRWQNGIVGQLENGNWEVTEPRGTGLIDTMSDLICNFVGTLCFLVPVLVLFVKKPSRAELFALERRQKRTKKTRPSPEERE